MDQIVGADKFQQSAGKKQWNYRAESMTDLAEFFEQQARNQDALMKSADTKKRAREHQMQAYAYRDVGKTIRETVIEPYGLTKMLAEHDEKEVVKELWANWITLSRLNLIQKGKP